MWALTSGATPSPTTRELLVPGKGRTAVPGVPAGMNETGLGPELERAEPALEFGKPPPLSEQSPSNLERSLHPFALRNGCFSTSGPQARPGIDPPVFCWHVGPKARICPASPRIVHVQQAGARRLLETDSRATARRA